METTALKTTTIQTSTISIQTTTAEKTPAAILALAICNGKLTASAKTIDTASKGYLKAVLALGDLEHKAGSTLWLPKVPGIAAERVLLVSMGDSEKDFRTAARAAVNAAKNTAGELVLALADAPPKGHDTAWAIDALAHATVEALYHYNATKSTKTGAPKLKKIAVLLTNSDARLQSALRAGQATGNAVNLAKHLGDLPPNLCTPSYLAQTAQQIAKQHGMKVEVLEHAQIKKLGMGSFLSVAKGSVEPMKLIVLRHDGGKKTDKPIVLVGKGITFDSGGISLKPGEGMDEMKYDMLGAASVLGTLQAAAAIKLPLNIIGVIPTCENMPAGNASKPGDIVTTMSGQTVEILNTDAEGRLILCDALTYVERFKPAVVVDIATLTGACVIALGKVASGLYANQDALAQELAKAGETAGDHAWHMPLLEEYQEQLKSNFADMANIGGRAGGSVTAACFLSRFTKQYPWAHLDIAGTAWHSGAAKGATGRPVPLLMAFLRGRMSGTAAATVAGKTDVAKSKPAAKKPDTKKPTARSKKA